MMLFLVDRAPSPSRIPPLPSRPDAAAATALAINRSPLLLHWRTTPTGLASSWRSALSEAFPYANHPLRTETNVGPGGKRRRVASRGFALAHGFIAAAIAVPLGTLASEPVPDQTPGAGEKPAVCAPCPPATALATEPQEPIPADNLPAIRVDQRFAIHYGFTVGTQWHPAFYAAYSGQNSMTPGSQQATSVVADLSGGLRLWRGAELWLEPEMSGGLGLSSTLGVAAFPSGEVYRVGNPNPTVLLGDFFFRQVFGLGGGPVPVELGPTQFAVARDRDAVTLTVGRFALTEVFDSNPLSNDPHTHFSSWGLWASAAYDYPADTHGYTWGIAGDLTIAWCSVRAGAVLEPVVANGEDLQWNVLLARGLVMEGEARFAIGGRPGAARLLLFLNNAHMGSYEQALAESPVDPNITATRAYGRIKYGFAASANQAIDDTLGVFARLSYNDGKTETWAFTEIDQSFAAGAVQAGVRWGRPDDEVGAGIVVSGISPEHRAYLAAGGYGFIIGDGALRYGLEVLGEIYYRLTLTREVSFIGTYQPIVNPAYNRDRGPVNVFGIRLHVAF